MDFPDEKRLGPSTSLSVTQNRDNNVYACKSNFEKRCFTCLKQIREELYVMFSSLIICRECCEHAFYLLE